MVEDGPLLLVHGVVGLVRVAAVRPSQALVSGEDRQDEVRVRVASPSPDIGVEVTVAPERGGLRRIDGDQVDLDPDLAQPSLDEFAAVFGPRDEPVADQHVPDQRVGSVGHLPDAVAVRIFVSGVI